MVGLLLALAIQCPVVSPDTCCDCPGGKIAPETFVSWTTRQDEWPCDGSVWWEVLGPSGEWGTYRCTVTYDPDTGEPITWCPQGVPPVRFETMHEGGFVAMSVRACNEVGCSLTCTRVYEWPSVCEFSDRAGMLACFGVVE